MPCTTPCTASPNCPPTVAWPINCLARKNAKGDKANLTKAERNELAGLVDVLVNIWKGRAKS
ncbi:MAG: hypothetical protein WBA83_00425 [Burkholderiaceae bacterium]